MILLRISKIYLLLSISTKTDVNFTYLLINDISFYIYHYHTSNVHAITDYINIEQFYVVDTCGTSNISNSN